MIRSVDATAGINWLKGGWSAFKDGGAVMIGMALAWVLAVLIARLIPYIGVLLAPLLATFLYAGMLIGLRGMAGGKPIEFEALFQAFKDQDKMVHIAIIALLPLLASLLQLALGSGILGLLLSGLLALAVSALVYFAVPLVLFRNLEAPLAMQRSLEAVLTNLPAVIVYWIIVAILLVLAMVPVGLGLLILIPVLIGAAYESYAEVFADVELDPAHSPAGSVPESDQADPPAPPTA